MGDIILQPVLTNAGMQAAFNNANTGIDLDITHVAAGDHGYTIPINDDGLSTLTSLKSEQERTIFSSGDRLHDHQLQVSFALTNDKSYWVRELGFYLADGTLFSVWSDSSNSLAYKSAKVPLVLGLELGFSALPANSVNISTSGPPLEILFKGELISIANALINLQHQQLLQYDQIIDLKEGIRDGESN